MNTPARQPRRLRPIDVIILLLVVCFLLVLQFANKLTTGLFLSLVATAFGAIALYRPEWLIHPSKSAEQAAKDRKWFRVRGFILFPLGLLGMLITFLWRGR